MSFLCNTVGLFLHDINVELWETWLTSLARTEESFSSTLFQWKWRWTGYVMFSRCPPSVRCGMIQNVSDACSGSTDNYVIRSGKRFHLDAVKACQPTLLCGLHRLLVRIIYMTMLMIKVFEDYLFDARSVSPCHSIRITVLWHCVRLSEMSAS